MFSVGVALSDPCTALLEQSAHFQPFYGNGLSDHVPMALVALDRLGASPGQLDAFYRASIPSLVKLEPAAFPVHPRDAIRNPNCFASVRLHYQRAIVEDGSEVVLRRWLPELVPGIAAASFHGLIRLGYAIETSNNMEIASGLALWTTAFASLGLPGNVVDVTPRVLVSRLSQLLVDRPFTQGLIVDRMLRLAATYSPQLANSQPRYLDVSDLADFAVSAYTSFDDFTLMHTLTATHAFRLIIPFVGDAALATRYFWRAILVAALSSGVPLHRDWSDVRPDPRDWGDIAARAIASDDEHVIKLVYSAFAESEKYANPLYRIVATRQATADGTMALAG